MQKLVVVVVVVLVKLIRKKVLRKKKKKEREVRKFLHLLTVRTMHNEYISRNQLLRIKEKKKKEKDGRKKKRRRKNSVNTVAQDTYLHVTVECFSSGLYRESYPQGTVREQIVGKKKLFSRHCRDQLRIACIFVTFVFHFVANRGFFREAA